MKKDNLEEKVKKIKKMFVMIGALITILSLIGFCSFAFGFNVIRPAIYEMGVIIGSGWLITAYVSKID